MLDRFRFRTWNKRDKRMIYNAEDVYDGSLSGFCENEDNNNDGHISCFGEYLGREEYVIMQSTGLKDKNGKLIYEGDILFNDSVEDSKFYAVVKWDNQLAKFYLDDGENYLEIDDDGFDKVIGNVYENKELLGEK